MPKKQLTDQESREILDNGIYGFLGLSRNDQPYVVPVNYVLDGDKIFLHGSTHGQKIEFLEANPHVCFTVSELTRQVFGDSACKFGMRYQSVIVYGSACLLKEPQAKHRALQALVKKYDREARTKLIEIKEVEGISLIEITIAQITGKANIDPEA